MTYTVDKISEFILNRCMYGVSDHEATKQFRQELINSWKSPVTSVLDYAREFKHSTWLLLDRPFVGRRDVATSFVSN